MKPPPEFAGIEGFLRDLSAQRARLEAMAGSAPSPDATDVLTELSWLSEQLIVAEHELRAQTEKLEATAAHARRLVNQWEQVFSHAEIAYILTDLNGIITNLNRAARELLEEPPHRPTRVRPIATKFSVEQRRNIRSVILRVAGRDEEKSFQSVLLSRNGHEVPVDISVSLISLAEDDTALWWRLLPAPPQLVTVEPPLDTSDFELAAWLAHAAQELSAEPTPDELLERTVYLAQASVPAADAVGVAYQRPGRRFEIMAVTGPLAFLADEMQYRLGEGPCVDAARLRHAVVTDDVTRDPRWPGLSDREIGVRSVLACYLTTPQGRAGSLSLYSRKAHAFHAGSQVVAEALAVHAGLALGATEQESTLRQAMGTREMIGQAAGILVERYKTTPTQAFALLVRASQRRNIKLRDVAAELIETGADPQPDP